MGKPYEEMSPRERAACHGRQAIGAYSTGPHRGMIGFIEHEIERAYIAGYQDGLQAAAFKSGITVTDHWDAAERAGIDTGHMEDQPDDTNPL